MLRHCSYEYEWGLHAKVQDGSSACTHQKKDCCLPFEYYLDYTMTGLLKTSHFSSEKRCKDKQKNSRLQVFFEIKKQGYKEGIKQGIKNHQRV
jgi:hypothetical protein